MAIYRHHVVRVLTETLNLPEEAADLVSKVVEAEAVADATRFKAEMAEARLEQAREALSNHRVKRK